MGIVEIRYWKTSLKVDKTIHFPKLAIAIVKLIGIHPKHCEDFIISEILDIRKVLFHPVLQSKLTLNYFPPLNPVYIDIFLTI